MTESGEILKTEACLRTQDRPREEYFLPLGVLAVLWNVYSQCLIFLTRYYTCLLIALQRYRRVLETVYLEMKGHVRLDVRWLPCCIPVLNQIHELLLVCNSSMGMRTRHAPTPEPSCPGDSCDSVGLSRLATAIIWLFQMTDRKDNHPQNRLNILNIFGHCSSTWPWTYAAINLGS